MEIPVLARQIEDFRGLGSRKSSSRNLAVIRMEFWKHTYLKD